MITSMAEQVLDAARRSATLVIQGGRSKAFYGLPTTGETLETRGLNGVISYEPTELVLHVKAGTPLAEVEALLAGKGQTLAFEPPHFGEHATIGGCIASGLSGPSRISAGSARDFVLGTTLLDGRGEVLKFGGQVMKNVAGYDVSRVLTGSLGTLGVLLDVSLKVLPAAQSTRSLMLDVGAAEALTLFDRWRARPLPITASAWVDGQLSVRLAGAPSAVDAAEAIIGGRALDAISANSFWTSIREQRHPFFAGDLPLWRVALPAGAPLLPEGPGLLEWHGMQRWLRGPLEASSLRNQVKALGGHATLFRASDDVRARDGVFAPLEPVIERIHRDLKRRFDPHGVFNRTRMYAHF
jgi:glycolate oxidase FAD binding subunit